MRWLMALLAGLAPLAAAAWFEERLTPEGIPMEVMEVEGSRATVILAHGCSGPSLTRDRGWASRLNDAGYSTVEPDSWAWRSLPGGVCQTDAVTGSDRVQEVERVVQWLRTQAWHRGPVFVLGWSHGGTVALASSIRAREIGIDKAVAIYPWCEPRFAAAQVPTQIHIGGSDDWTPAYRCRYLYRGFLGLGLGGSSLGEYYEYENVFHDYDRFVPVDKTYNGRGERGDILPRRQKSDPQARELTIQRVLEFLAR